MKAATLFGIYTVQFPYLDSGQTKLRPVIVISKPVGSYGVIAIVPISAQAKPEVVDIAITDWDTAGLIKPSTARVHRLTTVLESSLVSQLGAMSQKDASALQQAIKQFLDF